jgi:hypothetical protein
MAYWTFSGEPFRYDGGADPSADVDFGFKFMLQEKDGREAKVNVEAAKGAGDMLTAGNARDAITKYLNDDELPSRIVMDTFGDFHVA